MAVTFKEAPSGHTLYVSDNVVVDVLGALTTTGLGENDTVCNWAAGTENETGPEKPFVGVTENDAVPEQGLGRSPLFIPERPISVGAAISKSGGPGKAESTVRETVCFVEADGFKASTAPIPIANVPARIGVPLIVPALQNMPGGRPVADELH